jgi:predicted HTH domain antitoxin
LTDYQEINERPIAFHDSFRLAIPRLAFQKLLASRQIPVHYDVHELDAEVAMMQEIGYL